MAGSSIEWTEHTWNPVRGCVKVSPGCANCYAETFAERWRGVKGHAYEQGFDLRLVASKLDEPLRRRKPTTYFVNSMSDLFQEGVPDEFIDRVFAIMAMTPRHTYQILTKRAGPMRAYLSDPQRPAKLDQALEWAIGIADQGWMCFVQRDGTHGYPLPNVWIGVSVENQHFADERIPLLLDTPAAVRFISAEPLLGPIDLRSMDVERADLEDFYVIDALTGRNRDMGRPCRDIQHLDWVIVGGESGPGARPFDLEWARSIVAQCKAGRVPVFMKQLGAVPVNAVLGPVNPVNLRTVGSIRDRKGGDMAEWPEDLRVRQMPAAVPDDPPVDE